MTVTAELVRTGIKQAGRLASVFDPNSWRRWPPCVFGLHLEGDLNAELLGQAIIRVARRHTALRTYFPKYGVVDSGLCLAPDDVDVPLDILDLRPLPDADRTEAEQQSRRKLQDYFDPTCFPLVRAHLIRLTDREWQLGFAIDHLVFDGSSIGVFYTELERTYRELGHGLPESGSGSDFFEFCAAERRLLSSPQATAAVDHWLPIWKGVGPFPLAGLPTHDATNRLPMGDLWSRTIPMTRLTAARARIKARYGYVSPFAHAASAVLYALGEVSGRTDRALLYTSSRRFRPETAEMIGDLTDKSLLRVRADDAMGLDEHTGLVRDHLLDAAEHAEIPFEFIRDRLVPNPADQRPQGPFIMLNVDTTPGAPALDGLTARPAWPIDADIFREFSWLAVELELAGSDHATLSCGYQSTLIDPRVVDNFMRRVEAALTRV